MSSNQLESDVAHAIGLCNAVLQEIKTVYSNQAKIMENQNVLFQQQANISEVLKVVIANVKIEMPLPPTESSIGSGEADAEVSATGVPPDESTGSPG